MLSPKKSRSNKLCTYGTHKEGKMRIYTKPVKLNKGEEITYVAGRIGYKNSERKLLKY